MRRRERQKDKETRIERVTMEERLREGAKKTVAYQNSTSLYIYIYIYIYI